MGFFGIWRGMGLDGDGMSEGSYMGSGTVDLFVMCVFVLVWCVLPGVRRVCGVLDLEQRLCFSWFFRGDRDVTEYGFEPLRFVDKVEQ